MSGDLQALLTASREARRRGDAEACLRALTEARDAAEALGDDKLFVTTCWKLAKAEHDFGSPDGMLGALAPLLEREELFEHYDRGLLAADPIARHWWDHRGYGSPLVARLWERWAETHAQQGDPYLAAAGRIAGAWQQACRGDLDPIHALLDRYAGMTPAGFGNGPHRHAAAPDAPSSLFWVQMDVARTALRGATWAGAERMAWDAMEVFEDAAEDAQIAARTDYWFVEAALHAALRFREVPAWERRIGPLREATARALAVLDHERAPVHRPIGRGLVAVADGRQEDAVALFVQAADIAAARRPGFEWEVLALLEAVRADLAGDVGAPGLRERLDRAADLVERFHVRAFAADLQDLRRRLA